MTDWAQWSADTDSVALRGAKRDNLFLKGTVTCQRTGHAFDVIVRNLSAGGLLADSDQLPKVGDVLLIALRNVGNVPGRVVWVREGRFGMAFDMTIDPVAARQPVAVKTQRKPAAPPPPPRGGTYALRLPRKLR